MIKSLFGVAASSVFIISLFGCSPVPPAAKAIDIIESGKQVEIPVGGVLSVTLESNLTTGYSWNANATISDRKVLEQSSHQYQPPANQIPGAGGREVWTFTGLARGTSSIEMEYKRPFEPDNPPANTFNVTVIVK